MAICRYPRSGQRLAPAMLRSILELPADPADALSSTEEQVLLCDLDATAWRRFGDAACRRLAAVVVRAVAARIRTPALGGQRLLPSLPEGMTLTDLDLEPRTLNCLASAGLQNRPQDLRVMTLDDLLGLRGFWAKSLVDLLTALEEAAERGRSRYGSGGSAAPRGNRGCGDGPPAQGPCWPYSGERLAPTLLREVLRHRLPKELVRGTPWQGRQLADLDEGVWKHLKRGAIVRLASLVLARTEATARHPAILSRRLPQLPRGTTLADLRLEQATRDRLVDAGLTRCPNRLAEVTIGGLLVKCGLGSRGLVDLLTAMETAARGSGQLNSSLDAAAKALAAIPASAEIRFTDPRLGSMLCALDSEATNVAELAETICNRPFDPPDPLALASKLDEVRHRIDRMLGLPLNQELDEIFDPGVSDRNRRMMAAYLGWDGHGRRTAESIGQQFGLTRERVRQICGGVVKRVSRRGVFAPTLDRALAFVRDRAPQPCARLQEEFDTAHLASRHFRLDSLNEIARLLSREPGYEILDIGTLQVVAPTEIVPAVIAAASGSRSLARKCGLGSVPAVIAAAPPKSPSGEPLRLKSAIVRQVIEMLPDFHWLDNRKTWFRAGFSEHFGLAHLVTKVLSVAERIDASSLVAALLRCRRNGQVVPPRGVLVEYCRQMPSVVVKGNTIAAKPLRDWRKVLASVERTLVEVFHEHGPVVDRDALHRHCRERGMNLCTFNIIVASSPLLVSYGHCLYGLVGAKGKPPGHKAKRRTPRVLSRVLHGYGHMPDGKTYLTYQLSGAVVNEGLVTLPAGVNGQLQGKFALRTSDGQDMGVLTAKKGCGWGLARALKAANAQQGDRLVLIFDPAQRTAHLHLGDRWVLPQEMPLPGSEIHKVI